ncbi:fumarate hydratase [candidate division MSBL1 archaeon SCGC-AAA259I14]|uniref:Fumarate hydratase n=2 Tax=candidate division MSBL1 TaxID=215777 RepID=A0A133UTQ6_9EURY|nr:fumarate hydratase [candidate division MSBL1 archaeon SCGC-AAA259E22]KXA97614.1 fumarate hydratase [candidate division MSBL1 archaeon SCGC-AAA259I14]
MKTLKTPLDPEKVKELKVNDSFYVTGKIFTARDAAHEKLLEIHEEGKEPPFSLGDYPCYHCGPVMKKENDEWKLVSAGPTTSIRMEIFEDEFMDKFGTKIFVGKGGMGEKTLKALQKHGGVYAQFTGGAGSLMAGSVKKVEDVFYLDELGIPEAIWLLKVEEFGPLVVTMDSHGSSLHAEISEKVSNNLDRMKKELSEGTSL